jgi:hypothetical protein
MPRKKKQRDPLFQRRLKAATKAVLREHEGRIQNGVALAELTAARMGLSRPLTMGESIWVRKELRQKEGLCGWRPYSKRAKEPTGFVLQLTPRQQVKSARRSSVRQLGEAKSQEKMIETLLEDGSVEQRAALELELFIQRQNRELLEKAIELRSAVDTSGQQAATG